MQNNLKEWVNQRHWRPRNPTQLREQIKMGWFQIYIIFIRAFIKYMSQCITPITKNTMSLIMFVINRLKHFFLLLCCKTKLVDTIDVTDNPDMFDYISLNFTREMSRLHLYTCSLLSSPEPKMPKGH